MKLASTQPAPVFTRPWPVSDIVLGRIHRDRGVDTYLRFSPTFHAPGAATAHASVADAVTAAQLVIAGHPTVDPTLVVFRQDDGFHVDYVSGCDWSGTDNGIYQHLGSNRERAFTSFDDSLKALVSKNHVVLLGAAGTTTSLTTH